MTPAAALSWSLAAVACASTLSIAATNVALAALTASALWAWREDAALRSAFAGALRSPVLRLLGACAAWALVSALAGVDPAKGLKAWPKELHKMWVFAVIGAALGAADRGTALRGLGAGLAASALIGIGQTAAWSGGEAGLVRARAFIHAVSYGEMMGLGLLGAASWLALSAPKGRERAVVVGSAAALALALALNQTRAVLLALGAAIPALAFEAPRLRRVLLPALLGLLAVAAVWEVLPTGGRNLRTLLASQPESSPHRARLVLWRSAWDMSLERPVTGVGPGGFRQAFEERTPQHGLDGERVWGTAHNIFLHQLAERGFPGLALLLALFAALYAGARKAWAERRDAPALWALAATAAFIVMNLTEVAWQSEQVATFFLLCWLWGAGPKA